MNTHPRPLLHWFVTKEAVSALKTAWKPNLKPDLTAARPVAALPLARAARRRSRQISTLPQARKASVCFNCITARELVTEGGRKADVSFSRLRLLPQGFPDDVETDDDFLA